jgi:TrmH family RNA methyltransferase
MIMTAHPSIPRADPVITSRTNRQVADLVRLRLHRHRERTGSFLIEGYRELARALTATSAGDRIDLLALYYCPSLWQHRNEVAILARARAGGARLIELAEGPFRRISHRDRPDGLVGVGKIFPTPLDRLPDPTGGSALLLVVVGIEKPGNLGAMLRTACAAGVTGVIICDPATDPFSPGVVRASLGHLFSVPIAIADTRTTLRWLAERSIDVMAGTPDATVPSWSANLTGPTAIAIGSEQRGLSRLWLDAATTRVRIPMAADQGPGSADGGRGATPFESPDRSANGPDSLNAAIAAGVLLFEAVRQREVTGRTG